MPSLLFPEIDAFLLGSLFPSFWISHLYSNNSLALKILLHALQPLMLSMPAPESARDVLVQQRDQHSLMWLSLLWNIAVSACPNSRLNACYNWWGASLFGCRRWPLCILQLGGLFFCQRSFWSLWMCSWVLPELCCSGHKQEQERAGSSQKTCWGRWLSCTINGWEFDTFLQLFIMSIAHFYCYVLHVAVCCCFH